MDAADLPRLRARAHQLALAYAPRDFADDIAQEVLIMAVEGHGKKQALRYAVIDATRKVLGHTNGAGRGAVRAGEITMDRELEAPEDATPERDRELARIIDELPGDVRLCVVLFTRWGLLPQEIAFATGHSGHWVADKLQAAGEALPRAARLKRGG